MSTRSITVPAHNVPKTGEQTKHRGAGRKSQRLTVEIKLAPPGMSSDWDRTHWLARGTQALCGNQLTGAHRHGTAGHG